MASNPASELASAIQSVSLKRDPDPDHDLNPSTAASKKIPAQVVDGDDDDVDDEKHVRPRSESDLSSAASSSTIPS